MNTTPPLVSRALFPANAYNIGAHIREVYRTDSGFVAYAVQAGEIVAEAEGSSSFATGIALQKELIRLRDAACISLAA